MAAESDSVTEPAAARLSRRSMASARLSMGFEVGLQPGEALLQIARGVPGALALNDAPFQLERGGAMESADIILSPVPGLEDGSRMRRRATRVRPLARTAGGTGHEGVRSFPR